MTSIHEGNAVSDLSGPPSTPPRGRPARSSRVSRHVRLGTASVAAVVLIFAMIDADDWHWMLSMATAYVGLVLMGVTLALGPINVIRARPNPVSTNLRRDVGIWAGILALGHVAVGLQVHFGGQFWLYFVWRAGSSHRIPVRYDAFGLTNLAGLVATAILAMLLSLSNDWSLRGLGSERWKSLQRWNYVALALVVAHGFVFQLIERRMPPWVILLGALSIAIAVVQLAGVRAKRGSGAPSSR
jgi:sulfoxide reductase heme-binding subunit YedZ